MASNKLLLKADVCAYRIRFNCGLLTILQTRYVCTHTAYSASVFCFSGDPELMMMMMMMCVCVCVCVCVFSPLRAVPAWRQDS